MAIASESGYGAFLPKHRNELVDREALRGQMVKQASYLTEMDKVYSQLDEMARQFDVSSEMKESQFGRKLEYEYDALEQQAEQFESQLELDWFRGETERSSAKAQAGAASRRMDLSEEEFDFAQEQFDVAQDYADREMDMIGSYQEGLLASRGGGTSDAEVLSRMLGGGGGDSSDVAPGSGEISPHFNSGNLYSSYSGYSSGANITYLDAE